MISSQCDIGLCAALSMLSDVSLPALFSHECFLRAALYLLSLCLSLSLLIAEQRHSGFIDGWEG